MVTPLTYRATNDLMFKKLMTTIGKENILEGFVHDITDMTLTNVKPDNPYQIQSYKKYIEHQTKPVYQTIVDIAATTAEGIDVIIEMQVYSHQGFFERILNYWAAAFTKNHQPDHRGYKPVISIAVTNFQIFNEHDEVCVPLGLVHLEKLVEVYNKNQQPFERIFLVNLQGKDSSKEILNQWKKFFIDGIIDENEAPTYLKEAYELLQNTNLSLEEREMAETMTKQEEIYYSQLELARIEGQADGRAIGLTEGHAMGLAEGHATGLAEGHATGLAEGHATGLAEGLSRGAFQNLKQNILSLSKELSAEKIASLLDFPLEKVQEILKQNS